jgi:hypothetical protein
MGNRSTRISNQELLNSLNDRNHPEIGLIGQNFLTGQTISLPRSTAPSAELSVETVQMEANIERGTFKLERLPEGTYSLEFVFSSMYDCMITVLMVAEEIVDSHKVTQSFRGSTQKYPEPLTYKFSRGMMQPFPPRTAVLDLSQWTEAQLTYSDSALVPLVVEIVGFM